MSFEELQPGLIVVRYQEQEDLMVARQSSLLARLEAVAGPVAVIFEVPSSIRMVPLEVPTFWLGVTARADLQIQAMAIVTSSAGVRVAAGGFALANVARGVRTEVKTFSSVESASEWACELLLKAPARTR
jgi:hypothetical protein